MRNDAYIRFLKATEGLSDQLSDHEQQMLNEIMKRGDRLFRVQEIIEMRAIASQATLHKVLLNLVHKGYVSLEQSKEDGRIKYIKATKKTDQLLNRLNTLLKQSTTG
jgi:DNA-binding MarR family transcriptional regulator